MTLDTRLWRKQIRVECQQLVQNFPYPYILVIVVFFLQFIVFQFLLLLTSQLFFFPVCFVMLSIIYCHDFLTFIISFSIFWICFSLSRLSTSQGRGKVCLHSPSPYSTCGITLCMLLLCLVSTVLLGETVEMVDVLIPFNWSKQLQFLSVLL